MTRTTSTMALGNSRVIPIKNWHGTFCFILIAFCGPVLTWNKDHVSSPHPSFGDASTKVVVEEGDTARLPCVVHHLGDRSVTWMRKRDLHILTAGPLTYSADDRFQVFHTSSSDEWTLVVRFTQPRDAGVYECQVNADPKLSRPVTLELKGPPVENSVTKSKVFVANNTAATRDGKLVVEITGARELYIEEGSSLVLTCLVKASPNPPSLVYWYHGNTLIDYNSPRGGVNLKVDRGRGETRASMSVFSVGPGDSGMYSCVPPGSHPATVHVHVQKGEHEAAIQQGGLADPITPTPVSGGLSIHRPTSEFLYGPTQVPLERKNYFPLHSVFSTHFLLSCTCFIWTTLW